MSRDKVVAIIQARLGSMRLPRKILADIAGRPMLAHVAERALTIDGVHLVVMAMPWNDLSEERIYKELARIEGWGRRLSVWFGPKEAAENDVLSRFYSVASAVGADTILRLTGDCPLLDPAVCEKAVREHQAGWEFVADQPLPGLDVEVFSFEWLERAHMGATDAYDREHVTPWIRKHCVGAGGSLKTQGGDRTWPWLAVDRPIHLEVVRAIFAEHLRDYSMAATLEAAARAGVL